MWFTSGATNAIGRIDLTTKEITSYPLPFPGPTRIGSDGNVYFTEGNLAFAGNKVGQYNPVTGKLRELIRDANTVLGAVRSQQLPGRVHLLRRVYG